MPGSKTYLGTKKRLRITSSGKLTHETANKRHLLEHGPNHRTRRLSQDQVVAPSGVKRVKKPLGR